MNRTGTGSMSRQQEKSRQTMEELMDAAISLFASKGFTATSVAEITGRAGYAKGSFYRHWQSKGQLFLQIVEHKMRQYRDARDRRIADARNLEEAMRIIWDFLETMVSDSQWARIFLEFTVHSMRDEELCSRLRRSQYRLSEDIFADLVRPFVTTEYPAEKIGALNTALFEGFMVHNALEAGVLELEDVREAAVALAVAKGTRQ
jgi:AcrR family transcriptional regulator